MRHRDRSQPRELRLAVDRVFALADATRRRIAQGLVGRVDPSQQIDVGPRVARREAVALVDGGPQPARGHEAGNQPRRLRPAQPGHLFDVAPDQPAPSLAQGWVFVLDQNLLYPGVALLAALALKPDLFAGQKKAANRLQTQMLGLVHADDQSPA